MNKSESSIKRSLERLSTAFQSMVDFISGYDFFISYTWRDENELGRNYAIALKKRLTDLNYVCFLDSTDYEKGSDWKLSGQRALRKTTKLLLVATPAVFDSEPVLREVRIYKSTKRQIIPIDVNRTLENGPDDKELSALIERSILRIPDPQVTPVSGPSDKVIEDIHHSFKLTRQTTKRSRYVAGAMMALAVLAALASWQWREAVARTEEVFTASLASQSRALLADEGADRSRVSASLAVAAISRYSDKGQRSMAAERALRESLRLLPNPLLSFDKKEVDDFSFTPDSKYLVIGANGKIRVIATDGFGDITRFSYNHAPATAPEPRFIDKSKPQFLRAFNDYIVLSTEKTVEIHDIRTGKLLLDRAQISLVSVSEPGNFVAWFNEASAKIEIWFGRRPKETFEIPMPGNLTALFFSPAENYLAEEHTDGSQTWWELSSDGKVNRSISPKIVDKSTQRSRFNTTPADEGPGPSQISAPDWHYLLVSHETETDDGTTTHWRVVEPLTGLPKFDLPDTTIYDHFTAFFTPDGKYLVAWYDISKIRVWDTADWQIRIAHEGNDDFNESGSSVNFDPTGIVYLEHNFQVPEVFLNRITDISTGRITGPIPLISIARPGIDFNEDAFSADGRFLAISEETRARVFSTASGREIAHQAIDEGMHANFVELSPNGRFLVIGEAKNASPRDKSSDESSDEGYIPQTLRLYFIEPDTIHVTEDEHVRRSYNGCVIPWPNSIDPDGGKIERQESAFDRRYILEHDKPEFDSDTPEDAAKIIDRSTGRTVWEVPNDFNGRALPFVSPGGRFFGLADSEVGSSLIPGKGEMRIWETQGWKEVFKLEGDGVDDPIFSPDDKLFTVKSYNNPLKIMSSAGTPSEVLVFSTDELAVFSPDRYSEPTYLFTADNRYLVLGGKSNTTGSLLSLKCFPLYPQEMIKDACKRVGRNLSHGEWKTYFGEKPEKAICPDVQPNPGIDHPEIVIWPADVGELLKKAASLIKAIVGHANTPALETSFTGHKDLTEMSSQHEAKDNPVKTQDAIKQDAESVAMQETNRQEAEENVEEPDISASKSTPEPSVDKPPIKTGDTYVIESTNPNNPTSKITTERKVISVDIGTITIASRIIKSKTDSARTIKFTSEWNLISTRNLGGDGRDYSPPLKYLEFPLYPGKNWRQKSKEINTKTGGEIEVTISGIVGDWESVTVPAGTFHAIKVTTQTERVDRTNGKTSSGIDVSWYAPNVRRSVKSEVSSQNSEGKQEKQLIELIRYDLVDATGTP